jgi:tyrosyl-tRNA synthetase
MGPVGEQIRQSPRNAKVALAKHIIAWLHSPEAANKAEADFVRQFVDRNADAIPDDAPVVSVGEMGPGPHKLAPLLVKAGLAASNGEGTRKIKEGAVSVDGEKVTDFQRCVTVDKPTVLKLGRKYARLVP